MNNMFYELRESRVYQRSFLQERQRTLDKELYHPFSNVRNCHQKSENLSKFSKVPQLIFDMGAQAFQWQRKQLQTLKGHVERLISSVFRDKELKETKNQTDSIVNENSSRTENLSLDSLQYRKKVRFLNQSEKCAKEPKEKLKKVKTDISSQSYNSFVGLKRAEKHQSLPLRSRRCRKQPYTVRNEQELADQENSTNFTQSRRRIAWEESSPENEPRVVKPKTARADQLDRRDFRKRIKLAEISNCPVRFNRMVISIHQDALNSDRLNEDLIPEASLQEVTSSKAEKMTLLSDRSGEDEQSIGAIFPGAGALNEEEKGVCGAHDVESSIQQKELSQAEESVAFNENRETEESSLGEPNENAQNNDVEGKNYTENLLMDSNNLSTVPLLEQHQENEVPISSENVKTEALPQNSPASLSKLWEDDISESDSENKEKRERKEAGVIEPLSPSQADTIDYSGLPEMMTSMENRQLCNDLSEIENRSSKLNKMKKTSSIGNFNQLFALEAYANQSAEKKQDSLLSNKENSLLGSINPIVILKSADSFKENQKFTTPTKTLNQEFNANRQSSPEPLVKNSLSKVFESTCPVNNGNKIIQNLNEELKEQPLNDITAIFKVPSNQYQIPIDNPFVRSSFTGTSLGKKLKLDEIIRGNVTTNCNPGSSSPSNTNSNDQTRIRSFDEVIAPTNAAQNMSFPSNPVQKNLLLGISQFNAPQESVQGHDHTSLLTTLLQDTQNRDTNFSGLSNKNTQLTPVGNGGMFGPINNVMDNGANSTNLSFLSALFANNHSNVQSQSNAIGSGLATKNGFNERQNPLALGNASQLANSMVGYNSSGGGIFEGIGGMNSSGTGGGFSHSYSTNSRRIGKRRLNDFA